MLQKNVSAVMLRMLQRQDLCKGPSRGIKQEEMGWGQLERKE